MKKRLFIYCLIHVFSFNTLAQTVFNKIYYGSSQTLGGARANAVIQTTDNNFFVAGTTKNGDVMYSIKINNLGDTLWTKPYDLGLGAGADIIYSTIESNDNCYIIGGITRDINQPSSDAFLIKLKPNGDTAWVRKIGLVNRSERCYSVKQTVDGGYIFCGLRYNVNGSGSITDSDVYLVKTDSLGYPQWEKTYGGTDYEFGNSIELTNEGGYMICGAQYYNSSSSSNTFLIKTDSLGNMIWQKTYGGSFENYGSSIAKTNDGNYALAGYTYVSTDTIAAYVLKVDTAGTVVWEKKYKGNFKEAEFTAVKSLPTGAIMVSGDQQGDSLNYSYYGITKKLDTNGNLIWAKQYDYFNTDTTQHYFYAMDVCNDGGFVMAGMAIDLHYGVSPRNSMWLVKTDSNGCDNTGCLITEISGSAIIKNKELLIYPNPMQSEITIEFEAAAQNNRIEIKNMLGQIVYTQSLKNVNGKQLQNVDLTAIPKGVYFVQLKSDKQSMSKKFVKQ
jgi:hypothetical protein